MSHGSHNPQMLDVLYNGGLSLITPGICRDWRVGESAVAMVALYRADHANVRGENWTAQTTIAEQLHTINRDTVRRADFALAACDLMAPIGKRGRSTKWQMCPWLFPEKMVPLMPDEWDPNECAWPSQNVNRRAIIADLVDTFGMFWDDDDNPEVRADMRAEVRAEVRADVRGIASTKGREGNVGGRKPPTSVTNQPSRTPTTNPKNGTNNTTEPVCDRHPDPRHKEPCRRCAEWRHWRDNQAVINRPEYQPIRDVIAELEAKVMSA